MASVFTLQTEKLYKPNINLDGYGHIVIKTLFIPYIQEILINRNT